MDISKHFDDSASLFQLISLAEQDAWLSLGLMFHLSVLPLTRQLTNLSGFQWAKVRVCAITTVSLFQWSKEDSASPTPLTISCLWVFLWWLE